MVQLEINWRRKIKPLRDIVVSHKYFYSHKASCTHKVSCTLIESSSLSPFASATFISYRCLLSYSYQLLLPTPTSYSYQLLITGSRYYSLLYISYLLPYQLFLSIRLFSSQFKVLLSGNIITYSYHISYFYQIYFHQFLISNLLAY